MLSRWASFYFFFPLQTQHANMAARIFLLLPRVLGNPESRMTQYTRDSSNVIFRGAPRQMSLN